MVPSSAPEAQPLLSVVVPVFNEIETIDRILTAVRAVRMDTEIIVVDDFSMDGTRERLHELSQHDSQLHVFYHEQNCGKGAALRTGFAAARGRFIIVQDADLEYDPNDFPKLLQPLIDDEADVVFGSRFICSDGQAVASSWHSRGNRFLTWLSNKCTNLRLTDMETGYKAFRREIIQNIALREDRFGFEPEVTAKIARYRQGGQPLRIREVGVSYHRRSNEQGKKIGWKDGLWAVWCIFKYNWR
jgi:glycosyltransferase involved in cell wall biosynthesis